MTTPEVTDRSAGVRMPHARTAHAARLAVARIAPEGDCAARHARHMVNALTVEVEDCREVLALDGPIENRPEFIDEVRRLSDIPGRDDGAKQRVGELCRLVRFFQDQERALPDGEVAGSRGNRGRKKGAVIA